MRLTGSSAWLIEDLLEGNLAVELGVKRHEDRPEPPRAWGRRIWNRWPSEVAVPTDSWLCVRNHRRRVPSIWCRADVVQRRSDRRVAQQPEDFAGGATDLDRRQAVLDLAAMFLQMQLDHRFHAGALRGQGHPGP